MTDPTAPRHLSAASRRWWGQVVADFDLSPSDLRLLQGAAESWDRAQEARQRIAADGAYLADRFGQLRAHPGVAVERDARTLFARLLRELSLDIEPPDVRPPRGRRG